MRHDQDRKPHAERIDDYHTEKWAERVRAAQPPPMASPSTPPAAGSGPRAVSSLPELPDKTGEGDVAPSSGTHPTAAPALPGRERLRSHRKRGVRAHSTSMKRHPKGQLRVLAEQYPERPGVDYLRPRRRSECVGGERPCPFVSCRHHLYLDVSRTGSIKVNFPDLDVWDMAETCVLDVAEHGGEVGSGRGPGSTLEVVGAVMNVTRERIRQIEGRALGKLKRTDERRGGQLIDHVEEGGRRRLPLVAEEAEDEEGEADDPVSDEDEEPEDGDAEDR